MKKEQAKALFGKRFKDMADALGVGKSAISQWPEDLDQTKTNMVIGAAVRRGIKIPDYLLK